MKEGYSDDDIYGRLLAGVYDNSPIGNVQLRFVAKAFSHEIVLLWNEMNKLKEKIFDAPYLVPPSLLAAPVAYQIRCRPLYGADLGELDREDTFVSDNGMSFTLGYKRPEWGKIFIAQGNTLGCMILFSLRPVRTKVKRDPIFLIKYYRLSAL